MYSSCTVHETHMDVTLYIFQPAMKFRQITDIFSEPVLKRFISNVNLNDHPRIISPHVQHHRLNYFFIAHNSRFTARCADGNVA